MSAVPRATALIRFLLAREPSDAERDEMLSAGFDCDVFLVRLLCSDAAAERYGDLSQHFISHLGTDLAQDVLPHKLAHDLALAKEELGQLQAKLDRMSGQTIELLKHEDRIAALFDVMRGVQGDFNALRVRLEGMEARMLLRTEVADGH